MGSKYLLLRSIIRGEEISVIKLGVSCVKLANPASLPTTLLSPGRMGQTVINGNYLRGGKIWDKNELSERGKFFD